MSDMKQLLEDVNNAKQEFSEHCYGSVVVQPHDIQFMMHVDGSDSFSNYFRCSRCKEITVRTQKRTGLNKSFWNAED